MIKAINKFYMSIFVMFLAIANLFVLSDRVLAAENNTNVIFYVEGSDNGGNSNTNNGNGSDNNSNNGNQNINKSLIYYEIVKDNNGKKERISEDLPVKIVKKNSDNNDQLLFDGKSKNGIIKFENAEYGDYKIIIDQNSNYETSYEFTINDEYSKTQNDLKQITISSKDNQNNETNSDSLSVKTGDFSSINIWMIISLLESVFLILLIVDKIRKTSKN